MPLLDLGQYQPDNSVYYELEMLRRRIVFRESMKRIGLMLAIVALTIPWWYGIIRILTDLGIL